MTDKTEAQPEALRLADRLDLYATGDEHQRDVEESADELRRLHTELQQLKALNARLHPTIEDDSQEWDKCDPAIAFHLIERHADNWADAGKMMAEFADAKAEIKLKALRDDLTAQANRAAAAEQQVTALTQRLDMANRLNTDARNELAQLSARQAAPLCYLHVAATIIPGSGYQVCSPTDAGAFPVYVAAPPPPEREPLTDQQIEKLRKNSFSTDNPFCPCDRKTMQKAVWAAERAHGIGATNDNPRPKP